ncbi:forkhead box protein N1 isoform X2 [Pleurodeles waltl]|uniref:forkhead box protein N1 isoform X2 n=1 Tax=Pleurodeles waltl TaxID=8319 RepID=UPI0037097698
MAKIETDFQTDQNPLKVSILQGHSNDRDASDSVEDGCCANQQLNQKMQIRTDSGSPSLQTDKTNFTCQAYSSECETQRNMSESSLSPSPSPPPLPQDQMQGIFRTNQGTLASGTFKVCPGEKLRRYSCEETTDGHYERFSKGGRDQFHPYKRQFSEDVFLDAHQPMVLAQHSFKNEERAGSFEMMVSKEASEMEPFSARAPEVCSEPSWYDTNHHCSSQVMGSEVKLTASLLVRPQQEARAEMYCYQPPSQQMYCSPQPFHQYSSGGNYPLTYITSAHYPYQRIAPQVSSEPHQPLFPKPIYSYSILIFMALRNSKNGSLPVSEIYNFMTEHFPYFKTAPDGWKNSVRHNLSLNKCFEKVENKSGSSSRKGCLWALNPAKIDKMQEELQKWKRKDPVAVRKSMAKPEELDRLIGNKIEKMRASVSPSVTLQMSLQTQSLCETSSTDPESLQPMLVTSGSQKDDQQLRRHHSTNFSTPDHQDDIRIPRSSPQESPIPAHTPPIHSMKMLPELSSERTMQDTLMEGELSNDIDALNPSLTDFELHGNLWEELKDDSLSLDPLILVPPSQDSSHYPPNYMNCLIGTTMGNVNDISTPVNKALLGLPDLHHTSLYSSFMELDGVSPAYLNNSGSKPVALV